MNSISFPLHSVCAGHPRSGVTPPFSGGTVPTRGRQHRTEYPDGRIRFKSYGDVLEVCDIQADGWAAEAQVFIDGRPQDMVIYEYQVGGSGECQKLRASLGNPYDLTEGEVYAFRVCLDKSGTYPKYCDFAYWKA